MKKLARDKYLTSAEFEAFLNAIRTRKHVHAVRDLAMFAVCGAGALRVSELAALTLGDVARARETPAVITVWTRKQRRRQQDDVYLAPFAVDALCEYVDAFIWGCSLGAGAFDADRIFPISKRTIERLFKFYATRAGLNPRYSVHALRHYRGMKIYAETKDIMKVKAALRHSQVRNTEIYVQATDMEAVGALGV